MRTEGRREGSGDEESRLRREGVSILLISGSPPHPEARNSRKGQSKATAHPCTNLVPMVSG